MSERIVHPPAKQLAVILAMGAMQHIDQFDASGVPYILHPIKVMHYLKTDDYELMCIAVGHDLIEDTSTKFAELREWGMSDRVIEGIRALTKMSGETEQEYMARILANKDAIQVKMADLRHNSDIRRGKGLREKDFARLQKYHTMYKQLEQALK